MSTTTNNKNLSLQHSQDEEEEEDYIIDMESRSKNPTSSPQPKEFEFQNSGKTTINTADDLFYKGKLLPLLLLPSRRHLPRNLTDSAAFDFTKMPLYHSTPTTKTLNTPIGSCNISPSESCRASCELDSDDHFFEWSSELSSFTTNRETVNTNRSCRKKLPWYSKRLKALKSLFTRNVINCNSGHKPEEIADEYVKIAKATKTTTISAIMKSNFDYCKDDGGRHRKSFSIAMKRGSSDSSSSSFSRTSSATEIEGSIEAAIDHCKKSCRV